MSEIPRKVLIVKQEPPRTGYVAMMEVRDRTRSLQLSEAHGERLMSAMQDLVIKFAVDTGLVSPLDLIPSFVTPPKGVVYARPTRGRPRGSKTGGGHSR